MRYLDLTFSKPSANLACDEALLEWCENGQSDEILRFWEPENHFVVLGYANKWRSDVDAAACREMSITIFRRSSGGGAVLQGPGCLNFTLILALPSSSLEGIHATNRLVMEAHRDAVERRLGKPVQIRGYTDLTLESLKFSGNAQRRKRRFAMFHGTFLLGMDIPLVEKVLPVPERQPDYRRNRSHAEFLINLPLAPAAIRRVLKDTWSAREPLIEIPFQRIEELAKTQFASDEWNFKF